MEPANLKDFMRSCDPVADISRDRMTRLYSSILAECEKHPNQPQAYALTITPMQTTPWLAGALMMLALGIFIGQSLTSPYTAQLDKNSQDQVLASTWQSYMQLNK